LLRSKSLTISQSASRFDRFNPKVNIREMHIKRVNG
jgi:hypothetical protein